MRVFRLMCDLARVIKMQAPWIVIWDCHALWYRKKKKKVANKMDWSLATSLFAYTTMVGRVPYSDSQACDQTDLEICCEDLDTPQKLPCDLRCLQNVTLPPKRGCLSGPFILSSCYYEVELITWAQDEDIHHCIYRVWSLHVQHVLSSSLVLIYI